MYVLRKRLPGAHGYQLLLDIPQEGGRQYGSLEQWLERIDQGALLATFPSIEEAGGFIQSEPTLCSKDVGICGINFLANGLTFYPVQV